MPAPLESKALATFSEVSTLSPSQQFGSGKKHLSGSQIKWTDQMGTRVRYWIKTVPYPAIKRHTKSKVAGDSFASSW